MITTPDILATKPTATFPTGTDDLGTAPVPAQFIIAETLTTYQLWSEVKTWATSHGYTFDNAGNIGSDNSGSDQQPVTKINWRDAMVWCNALTEYFNANNGAGNVLVCVYTYSSGVIRDSGNTNATACDAVVQSISAKGFRLPTSVEYEFAARYRGTDSTNAILSNGVYYTKGNSASGATAGYTDATATAHVSVYMEDSFTTAPVKSKAANALGLYDMSGNAWEWNFDRGPGSSGSYRVERGGCFSNNASCMQVGCVNYDNPIYVNNGIGFRFVRTR